MVDLLQILALDLTVTASLGYGLGINDDIILLLLRFYHLNN